MKFLVITFIVLLLNINVWADIPDGITQKLVSDNAGERQDACILLGKLGTDDAVFALKELLKDRSMLVRHSAANALSNIGGPKVVDIFRDMVLKNTVEAKRLGLVGIAITGDSRNVDLIIKQLDNPDWQVRWTAVYTLGKWGYRPAIPRLRKIAENDPYLNKTTGEYPVRKRAVQMCTEIMRSVEWCRTFDYAVMLSKKLQRPMLIYYRLNNSPWCKKLEEDAFSSFRISDISRHFVSVELDVEKNAPLVSQCEITGVPFIIILDKEGMELDRILGYISKDRLIRRLKNALEGKGTPKRWKEDVANDPSNIKSLWYLSQWYLDNNRLSSAIPLLENIIKYDPKNKLKYTDRAVFVLGYSIGSAGNYKKAIGLLENLRNSYPEFKDMDKALYCLGLDYLSTGNIQTAKQILNNLLNNYPKTNSANAAKEVLNKL